MVVVVQYIVVVQSSVAVVRQCPVVDVPQCLVVVVADQSSVVVVHLLLVSDVGVLSWAGVLLFHAVDVAVLL